MSIISTQHPACVLGLFDTGLAVVRLLARSGIPILGLDFSVTNPGLYSRYCKALVCPSPLDAEKELLDCLLDQGRSFSDKAVLLPCSDAFVLFVSQHRESLSQYYLFNLPPGKLVESLMDKNMQNDLALAAGLSSPRTCHPQPGNIQAMSAFCRSMQFPLFVKPVSQPLWQQHFWTKGVGVNDEQSLRNALTHAWSLGLDVVVQEIIVGPAQNHIEVSTYVDIAGKVQSVMTVKKLRQYPRNFGTGSLVETCENQQLEKASIDFIRKTGLTGFANIEFKMDERDQHYKYIETNARPWQQIELAAVAGVNFPLLAYCDLTGQSYSDIPSQITPGLRWIDPLTDFLSVVQTIHSEGNEMPRWFQDFMGASVRGVFAMDDLKPGLKKIDYGRQILSVGRYWARSRFGSRTKMHD